MTCDAASRYGRGNDAVSEQHFVAGYKFVALAIDTLAFGPAARTRPLWEIVDYRTSACNTGQKKPPVEKKLAIPNNFSFEPVISSLLCAEFNPLADIGSDY
jgi:hypothetical protein